MPKQAKRRFVGLNTEEVSLVDSPANEVEFLVTKNHREKKNMGANAATKVLKKERVSVEVDGDEDDTGVTKALQHVNSIVDKIASMVSTTKADDSDDEDEGPGEGEEESTEGDDGDSDDEKETEDQPVEKALSIKALLTKCGMEGTALKSALIKLKAAGVDPSGSLTQKAKKKAPPFFAPKGPKGAKKPASADDDEDEDEDEKGKKTKKAADDEEGPLTMAGLADAVQKAAAFTPARIKALQNAQDTLKLVLEAVTPGHSPETNTPAMRGQHNIGSELQPSGKKKPKIEGTLKSADEELISTLKSLSGAVGDLCERVEAIEKARPGSNSADNEGTTDSVKKSQTLWSGVL